MSTDDLKFLRVIIDVPEALADEASIAAFDAGARGVEIRDSNTLNPEPLPEERSHVIAWVDPTEDREKLHAVILSSLEWAMKSSMHSISDVRLCFDTVDAIDWVAVVREQFMPVKVGRRLKIRPSWQRPGESRTEGDVEIVLDPGLAFGTGHHATTFLCLEELEKLMDEPEKGRKYVLDVGTGSGILAIAAALTGADYCAGIDNDPMAIKVAIENAQDNGAGDLISFSTKTPDEIDEIFDIAVANIQLGPLVELARSIVSKIAPGGRLILSGLLDAQADAAEKAYIKEGMLPYGRKSLDGWTMLSMIRLS